MADFPSGTVTFLFTDIEGSTRLVKQLREGYGAVVAEHQRLLRAAFANHGGHEVDTQGDSFFVVFSRARDAVLSAVEAQRGLRSQPWPEGVELNVRMGIHTGQAVAADGRYTGLAVHRAARIGSAGHGGQVLVSQATQTLLEDEEEDLQIGLRDLGEHHLKDLDRPVRLFQVTGEGLPDAFPPPRHGAELAQAAEAALAAPSFRDRRLLLAALAAAAAAAATIAIVLLMRGGDGVTVRPNSVGIIDVDTNSVVDQIRVGTRPGPMAIGADSVWVANLDDRTVARVDPRARSVTRYFTLAGTPTGLAYGEGAIWVANGLLGTLQRVDPQFGSVGDPIETGAGRASSGTVAVGFGSVWFASGSSNIVRLDPTSGTVVARLFSGAAPSGIAVDDQSVWVANHADASVYRFSPATNQTISTPAVSSGPTAIATGGGAVWVANASGTVSRIDPSSGSTFTIRVGQHPAGIAYGAGSVWVTNGSDGTVSRIDPARNEVSKTIHVGNNPQGIAVSGDLVWVAVQAP